METSGKTSIIDSDFRAGAIFYSLTNALLFSFSVTATIVFSRLSQKSNTFDGVNVLAMTIISGIISAISGGLFFYSLYKVIKVAEMRDKIKGSLDNSVSPGEPMPEPRPAEEKLRSLEEAFRKNQNRQMINLPQNLPQRNNILSRGLRGGIV